MRWIYLFCVCFLGWSCADDDIGKLEHFSSQEDIPGVERGEDVEILYSDSAVVRIRIKAPVMLNHRDKENPRREFTKGVDVDVFNAAQQQTSKLTAKYAEQFDAQRVVHLRDSVVLWNNKNERLETDELVWHEQEERIYSTEKVKITTPSQEITGYGFRSNLKFTKWEIDSVSGIIEARNFTEGPI